MALPLASLLTRPTNDNDHVPVGYNALEVAMNNQMCAIQLDCAGKSYFHTGEHVHPETFDINWGDIVFTLDDGIGYTGFTDKSMRTGTYAAVGASLNGIEGVMSIPEVMTECQPLVDAYFFLNARVIGCAAGEMPFYKLKSFDLRLFSVAYSGIISRKIHHHVKVGETLMYCTPKYSTFSSPGYRSKDGATPGKIALDLCPVRQVDSRTFALSCYNLSYYISKNFIKETQTSAAKINTVAFGKSMDAFANLCGQMYLYQLLLDGYVVPLSADMDAYMSLRRVYLKAVQKPFNGSEDLGMDLFVKKMVGEKVYGGTESDRLSIPKGSGTDLLPETPEQIAILMAIVTGTIQVGDESALPDHFKYRKFIQESDMKRGEAFKERFLQRVFPRLDSESDAKAKIGTIKRVDLRLGAHSQKAGGDELCQQMVKEGSSWKRIVKRNGYGHLESAYKNAFSHLVQGLHLVNGLERSRVAGMALSNTAPGQTVDFIACK